MTVEAELRGLVSNEPLKNYTGVPLYIIIETADPISEVYTVTILASDGYQVELNSTRINRDRSIILTMETNGLRLVGQNLPGNYWVKKVNRLEIKTTKS